MSTAPLLTLMCLGITTVHVDVLYTENSFYSIRECVHKVRGSFSLPRAEIALKNTLTRHPLTNSLTTYVTSRLSVLNIVWPGPNYSWLV